VVSQPLVCPSFENLFNPESLEAMKFIVFQIRLVEMTFLLALVMVAPSMGENSGLNFAPNAPFIG
jgi:hypothetical protein